VAGAVQVRSVDVVCWSRCGVIRGRGVRCGCDAIRGRWTWSRCGPWRWIWDSGGWCGPWRTGGGVGAVQVRSVDVVWWSRCGAVRSVDVELVRCDAIRGAGAVRGGGSEILVAGAVRGGLEVELGRWQCRDAVPCWAA
jgi:hypothetical protein